MSARILIAYASKSNATADYAGFLAGELIGQGFHVDQVNLRETGKPEIGSYNLIILGTGVRIGRLYGPVKKMLKREDVKAKPVAVFISCGMAIAPDKRGEAIATYLDKILDRNHVKAVSKAAFPGKMPGTKTDFVIETEFVRTWIAELLLCTKLTS